MQSAVGVQGERALPEADAQLVALLPELLLSPEAAIITTDAGFAGVATLVGGRRRQRLAVPVVLVYAVATLTVRTTTPVATVMILLGAASLVLEARCGEGLGIHATGAAVSLTLAGLWLDGPWRGAHPAVAVIAAVVVAVLVRSTARAAALEAFVLATDAGGASGVATADGAVWRIRDVRNRLAPGRSVTALRRDDGLVVRHAGAAETPGSQRRYGPRRGCARWCSQPARAARSPRGPPTRSSMTSRPGRGGSSERGQPVTVATNGTSVA